MMHIRLKENCFFATWHHVLYFYHYWVIIELNQLCFLICTSHFPSSATLQMGRHRSMCHISIDADCESIVFQQMLCQMIETGIHSVDGLLIFLRQGFGSSKTTRRKNTDVTSLGKLTKWHLICAFCLYTWLKSVLHFPPHGNKLIQGG